MNVDRDGFLVSDETAAQSVIAPPPAVAVPKFFNDCPTREHAAIKMINELAKPYSYEMEGHDTAYRRLADALILVLTIQADFEP